MSKLKVGINGFGRIGRLVTRLMLENTGNASVMRLRPPRSSLLGG
jgi:glyceraldehyde-3-phosphate dehydrogenase/erythrose-4-phosphate dehydrogenase